VLVAEAGEQADGGGAVGAQERAETMQAAATAQVRIAQYEL
jgi:hypothetical protein